MPRKGPSVMAGAFVALLAADLILIVVVARVLGALARLAGQPEVVGEILGGILLGPTVFTGTISGALFTSDIRQALSTFANLGICVFMFFVGLRLNREHLSGQGSAAAGVAIGATILPFGLGILLAVYVLGAESKVNPAAFALYIGVAMSVTAFPVLARIIVDKRLIDSAIGGISLAAAALCDVFAWMMLAAVAAMVTADGGISQRTLLVLPFALLLLLVVRPVLARLATSRERVTWLASAGAVGVVGIGLALSSFATQWMGLHFFFGAFLFGVVMPRAGFSAIRETALPLIERVSSRVLLPVFFVVAGLNVNLRSLNGARRCLTSRSS